MDGSDLPPSRPMHHDSPACAKYFIPVSRVVNMGLACLMAFAAVNGIMKIVEFRLDTFFVAVYML